MSSGSDAALKRAEDLLARLEESRRKLESTTDPDEAIDVLQELAEIAKQVEAELARAKREADEGV
jgi:exonuclease VII small subunit